MSDEEDRRRAYKDRLEEKEWEDIIETLVKIVLSVVVIGALAYGGASWLDGQFGWNLTGWLKTFVGELIAGLKG